MTKIKNINERYGMPIEFSGASLPDAIYEMANAIHACGPEIADGQTVDDLCNHRREDVDYTVVD